MENDQDPHHVKHIGKLNIQTNKIVEMFFSSRKQMPENSTVWRILFQIHWSKRGNFGILLFLEKKIQIAKIESTASFSGSFQS